MPREPSTRDEIQRLLVRSVYAAPVTAADTETPWIPTGEDAELLFRAAAIHRIRPAVHRELGRIHPPASVADPFAAASAVLSRQHLRVLADLEHVARTLNAAGIPWVVGKGPVAAATVWPSADMREYYDLDIYVARSAFPAAVDALVEAGGVGLDRNWPEMRRLMRAEYAMLSPHGTMLDLHWDIAVRQDLRRAFRIDLSSMIGRARRVSVGLGMYPTFEPVDTTLLFAFHAAQAGANRLMWLGDVFYATRDPGFSWPLLEERAHESRTTAPISIVMERTDRALGFDLDHRPRLITAAGAWARFVRWYDNRQSSVFIPGDRHSAAGAAGAARPTLHQSVAAAIRGRREVRRGEREAVRKGVPRNPLEVDVPDVRARAAYMAAAEGKTSD